MKQTSESAVQPRRNLLTALGVWVVGLWGSTKLWAGTKAEPKCDKDFELALVVGRLCIDPNFRNTFFDPQVGDDMAIQNTNMVTRPEVKDSLKKVRARKARAGLHAMADTTTTTSTNPVQVATESVGVELYAAGALMPCNPWPC